jgi:2-iminobutanoate/2-iminopropanoate deaminase
MSNEKQALFPEGGPAPVGPYSPIILSGDFVFLSGMVGRDPASGHLGETIEEQTRQTLENIGRSLRAAGCDFKDVVKATCFITQADYFKGFNEVYKSYFPEPRPARSTVVCELVLKDLLVEIEVIARRGQ